MTFKREKRPFQNPNYHFFPKGLTQAMAFFNKKHGLTQDSFLSGTLLNIISNPVLNAKKLRKHWNLTKSK